MVSATTRQVTGQGCAEQKLCGSIRWRRVGRAAYSLELLLREHAVAVLVHQCEELRRFGRGMGRRCIEHQFKPARGEQRAANHSSDNRVYAPLARVLQTRPFPARAQERVGCMRTLPYRSPHRRRCLLPDCCAAGTSCWAHSSATRGQPPRPSRPYFPSGRSPASTSTLLFGA